MLHRGLAGDVVFHPLVTNARVFVYHFMLRVLNLSLARNTSLSESILLCATGVQIFSVLQQSFCLYLIALLQINIAQV